MGAQKAPRGSEYTVRVTSQIASPRPPKRRRFVAPILVTLLILIAATAGAAYLLAYNWFSDVQKVGVADPSLSRPAETVAQDGQKAPINILLLGSDSREATTDLSDMTGFRSDAIMLAQVSSDRKHLTFMSIMRDNWVPIEGHGEAKINAAFSYGGVPLAVNTVEHFIDARIDHVMIVDFESFKGLTDAVGGVTVHNDVAFTSSHSDAYFEEGEIRLESGDRALDFVRERYSFADGDYQRVRNQQAFMKGLVQSILARDTLSSPSKLLDTANALKPYLIVDEEFTLNTALGLGLQTASLRGDGIAFFTSPTLGTGTSDDGQSIVIPDMDEMANVRAAIRAGTLQEYAAAAGQAEGS